MKITILGSGTSHGIPVLGCNCPVCNSSDSRDQRLRSSLYIQGSGAAAVIDTGPEFRLQALRAGIRRLDAVFLTHSHADHIHGADDLRPLSKEPLPIYGNRETIEEFQERFSYVFRETQEGGGKPRLRPMVAEAPIAVGKLLFSPIPVRHGALSILGWRIDEIGTSDETGTANNETREIPRTCPPDRQDESPRAVYLTDTSEIPGPSWALIGKPAVLIIGGLRTRPHPTHFSFGEALEAAAKIGARRSFLTHLCHDYSHREIEEYCRNYREEHRIGGLSMAPAYDGLELTV
jgi:phosphoribosyl 1,2-cyclic phosphate phosphodiesterase